MKDYNISSDKISDISVIETRVIDEDNFMKGEVKGQDVYLISFFIPESKKTVKYQIDSTTGAVYGSKIEDYS
ncbi:MAG: hypothetical protein FWH29_03355 [Methanobrevibacter sp.]|nr:hypothetical protein [Methanobrevibacter sp.]